MNIGLAEISFFRHAVEEALNTAKSLLNTESGSYDYYEIKTDGRTGPLSLYMDFITDLASSFKADELARNYIAMAKKLLNKAIRNQRDIGIKPLGNYSRGLFRLRLVFIIPRTTAMKYLMKQMGIL